MLDLAEQTRGFIDSGATAVTAQEVVEARRSSVTEAMGRARSRRPRRMNTYAVGAAAMATAICVLVVVLVFGFGSASPPKSTVVSPGPSTAIPASWQKVTFGGLTMYAPRNWPTVRRLAWGNCGFADQPFEFSTVVLDSGAQGVAVECPLDSQSYATCIWPSGRPRAFWTTVGNQWVGQVQEVSARQWSLSVPNVDELQRSPRSFRAHSRTNPTRCSRDWSGGWWKGGPHH